MSARLHAIVNLAMNFLLWLGVWVSIFLNYFAFRVIFTQDYQVGLKTLTHLMKYEDVLGEVYTSFYNFQEFACNSSHDDGILTVCSNLTNFTVAGIIYLLIAYVLIITLILTQANLLMLVLQRNNFLLHIKQIHYLNCPLFIFGGGSYLLISNVDHLEPPHEEKLHVSADSGIPMLFILAAWSILTLLHFLFLKHIKGLNTTYKLSNALVESILSGMGSPSNDSLNRELKKKVSDLEQVINERNEELQQLNQIIFKKKSKVEQLELGVGIKKQQRQALRTGRPSGNQPLAEFQMTDQSNDPKELENLRRQYEQDKAGWDKERNLFIITIDDLKNQLQEQPGQDELLKAKQEIFSLKQDNIKLQESNQTVSKQNTDLTNAISQCRDTIREQGSRLEKCENVQKERDDYYNQLMPLKDEHSNCQKQIRELRAQLDNLMSGQDDAEGFQGKISSLSIQLEKQKEANSELRTKMDQSEAQYGKEIEDQQYTISRLNRELDQSRHRQKQNEDFHDKEMQEMQNRLDNLQDEVKVQSTKYELSQHEVEKLQMLLDKMKQNLLDKEVQLSELSQEEMRVSTFQDKKLKDLESGQQELKKVYDDANQKLMQLVNEKEELRQQLQQKSQDYNDLSNDYRKLERELMEMRTKRRDLLDQSIESSNSQMSQQSAQELMIIENLAEIDIRYNPILEIVSRVRKEAPMTYSNVWKVFESMMQEKYTVDRLEIALGRQPRSLWDYLSDFMYLHYGVQTLALKQTRSLVSSLEELYKIKHQYGTLICRMLGIFHPRPIPTHVTVCLTLLQEQFNIIARQQKRQSIDSFAKQYEITQYGGEASIVDLMELVMKICRQHRDMGERVISKLTPNQQTNIDLIILKICGTMSKMGQNSDYIFEVLDIDQGGSLDYHEFVDGIRFKLNIWVTQDEAEFLCEHIDEEANGKVTRQEWDLKTHFDTVLNNANADFALVTKAQFIDALVEEYESQVVNDYYNLRQQITTQHIDYNAFDLILSQLDSQLQEHEIHRLFEESLEQDGTGKNKVSPEAMCITVIRNRIGGYGVGIFDEATIDAILPKTRSEAASSPNKEINQ